MTPTHDTDPRSEIARLDAEITDRCLVRDMTGAMNALNARRALEASLKGAVAVGVSVFALIFAAVASAHVNWLAKAQAAATTQLATDYAQVAHGQAEHLVVKCAGKPAKITCNGYAGEAMSNGTTLLDRTWNYRVVYAVKHGKLTTIAAPYSVGSNGEV